MSNPNDPKSISKFKGDEVNGETIIGGGSTPDPIIIIEPTVIDDPASLLDRDPNLYSDGTVKKGIDVKVNSDGTVAS